MRALLVGSIASAKHAYQDNLMNTYVHWVTYRPGTALYCRDQLDVTCIDLNSYLSITEPADILYHVFPLFTELLLDLDKTNASVLNGMHLPPDLNWYFTFRMEGLYEYSGLIAFDTALRRYLATTRISHLSLYESIAPAKKSLFGNLRLQILNDATAASNVTFNVHLSSRRRKLRAPFGDLNKIKVKASLILNSMKFLRNIVLTITQAYFTPRNSPILIFEPQYELNYLPLGNRQKIIVRFLQAGNHLPAWAPYMRARTPQQLPASSIDCDRHNNLPYANLVAELMTDYLRQHIHEFDAALRLTEYAVRRYKIKTAVWGNSPCEISPRSVVTDYLRKLGVCVIGIQHGANYGTVKRYDAVHTMLDYLSCDKFLCYGKHNLEVGYIPKTGFQPATMIATGSLKCHAISKIQSTLEVSKIDILFPMDISCDLLMGDVYPPCNLVLARQVQILNYLESSTASVVLKLVRDSLRNRQWREQYFQAYNTVKQLRNCTVNDKLSLTDALAYYRPKLVLLENLSTPLTDCVFQDVDIILFVNPFTIKDNVRFLLEKRVHLADTFDAFMELLALYLSGHLPKLRNSEFYDTQVCPPGNAFNRALAILQ